MLPCRKVEVSRRHSSPSATRQGKAKNGVRIYKATDSLGTAWEKSEIDPGGVAVEDLTAGDLNGDGKIDLIAVGRATQNVRIYWNETAAK